MQRRPRQMCKITANANLFRKCLERSSGVARILVAKAHIVMQEIANRLQSSHPADVNR